MDCVFEDGEVGFGLCCFNGCINECLHKQKTCKNVNEIVTETILEEQCINEVSQKCCRKIISVSGIEKKIREIELFLYYFRFVKSVMTSLLTNANKFRLQNVKNARKNTNINARKNTRKTAKMKPKKLF